jgi:hypothetical protein
MTRPVFFRPSLAKVSATVSLIAETVHSLDRQSADWIAYQADRAHLNRFGRPVLGLRYRSREGLPESLELAELFSSQGDGTACVISGGVARRRDDIALDYDLFSKSDLDAISDAVTRFLTLGSKPRALDMPRAWSSQANESWIGYEHMLDAGPNRQAWLEDIAPFAPHIRF